MFKLYGVYYLMAFRNLVVSGTGVSPMCNPQDLYLFAVNCIPVVLLFIAILLSRILTFQLK
jgi:hypothetical protein